LIDARKAARGVEDESTPPAFLERNEVVKTRMARPNDETNGGKANAHGPEGDASISWYWLGEHIGHFGRAGEWRGDQRCHRVKRPSNAILVSRLAAYGAGCDAGG
jgi:hypothetical protein